MEDVKTQSLFRKDEKERLIEVSFTKKNGELCGIRVCTFFTGGVKLRSDYCKDDEEFETIRAREEAYLRNLISWISK